MYIYIYVSVSRPHAATDPSWKVSGHSGLELKVKCYYKEKNNNNKEFFFTVAFA